MVKNGFEPRKTWTITRENLQNEINKTCKELFGEDTTREDLGIVASARGVMIFDGKSYPIESDNIIRTCREG